jgi:hypothetical protein
LTSSAAIGLPIEAKKSVSPKVCCFSRADYECIATVFPENDMCTGVEQVPSPFMEPNPDGTRHEQAKP